MKTIIAGIIAAVVVIGGAIGLLFIDKVPSGNVGVRVNLLGGERGVDTEELTPGRYFVGINQELYLFPTFTQNYEWTADSRPGSETDESFSFQTVEGLVVNADIGITYKINPTMVNDIFQRYRRGINEITDQYLRNIVRDELVTQASTLRIESVYGAGKNELMQAIEVSVRNEVASLGIEIERIYWLSEMRIPSNVTAALNAKIEATQRAAQRENEVAEARAEAQKTIEVARGRAESVLLEAQAQAEANRELAASITPELVRYLGVQRWNGELPRFSGATNAIPFIDVTPEMAN